MKINESRSVLPGQPEVQKSTQGDAASASSSSSAAKPNTGVNVDVSPTLTTASTVAISSSAPLSDAEALDKIQKLIESGQFNIDFPKTAELILLDAVAAAGNSSKF